MPEPRKTNCPQCGKEFTTNLAQQRFCSNSCRNASWHSAHPTRSKTRTEYMRAAQARRRAKLAEVDQVDA